MQSTYSWMGSPIQLVVEDAVAEAFNRAQDAYAAYQEQYFIDTGQHWSPAADALRMVSWTPEERDAYYRVNAILDAMADLNGGAIEVPANQITSKYLVRRL